MLVSTSPTRRLYHSVCVVDEKLARHEIEEELAQPARGSRRDCDDHAFDDPVRGGDPLDGALNLLVEPLILVVDRSVDLGECLPLLGLAVLQVLDGTL